MTMLTTIYLQCLDCGRWHNKLPLTFLYIIFTKLSGWFAFTQNYDI